ncbi:MAG: hypothetical protein KKI02_04865 [Planctomycetes bacterium]|nr:hypothetical protein [Planctomycetota bacterium]
MHRKHIYILFVAAIGLLCADPLLAQDPIGTVFTYQGELKQAGTPVDGLADFEFTLWDDPNSVDPAHQVGSTVAVNNVGVVRGLFTVQLDFGAAGFDGEARWLEIAVRSPAGGGSFTTLSPRQPITPTPYATFSRNGDQLDGFDSTDFLQSVPNPLTLAGSQPGGHIIKGSNASETAFSCGVFGESTSAGEFWTYGVLGRTSSRGAGVCGEAPDLWFGVQGTTGEGTGAVPGFGAGVWGDSVEDFGVVGFSQNLAGVYGAALSPSGENYGVFGESGSYQGTGVYGRVGFAGGGIPGSCGVVGESGASIGVTGISGGIAGVAGVATNPSELSYGVCGQALSPAGYGVYSEGNFAATGTKSFQIDHPLDPANQYLNHYCAEGPEPLNVYTGAVVTDENGCATVTLPDYFEAINRDFRYQLTVVDESDDFVMGKVAHEIQDNRFVIRTSKPRVKVCWAVTGVRNDPWVRRYGAPVEQAKAPQHRGTYLHPGLCGMPSEQRTSLWRTTTTRVAREVSRDD